MRSPGYSVRKAPLSNRSRMEQDMAASFGDAGTRAPGRNRIRVSRRDVFALAGLALTAGMPGRLSAAPQGQLTWGVHISLAPTWFDPAETPGIITPFMVMYALHDALVKPMPGQPMGAGLAESWSASEDALVYDFVLRDGIKFHNDEPVTAEDVKFSFDRYRGTSHDLMKARVGSVGFKKAPIGAGPYKFVSFNPGIELTLEAFDGYWRKTPSVKRLIFRCIPDESTRLAALKRGEVDIVYSIRGELAEELRATPGLTLKPSVIQGTQWVYFADQWDPKSPWHDERVRRAASIAIDRDGINQALTLGYSRLTGNPFVPDSFDFYWQPPKPVYDPAKAKQLLAEAGHPKGFDAGEFYCDSSYSNLCEAIVNNLREVGINARLLPLERRACFKGYAEKKYRNLIMGGSGAFGNA